MHSVNKMTSFQFWNRYAGKIVYMVPKGDSVYLIPATVCGYEGEYIIVGFDDERSGCIASFSPHITFVPHGCKSFRFIKPQYLKIIINIE